MSNVKSKKKMSKTQREKTRRKLNNRRGVILIAAIAVMILVVNLIAGSYSWFTPGEVSGKGLYISETTSVRSENCIFSTYQGVLVTEEMKAGEGDYDADDYVGYYIDQIKYNDTALADNDEVPIPAAVEDPVTHEITPSRVYFRTYIQNQDRNYPSIVSLYHHEMPADLYVAITYPTNTYHYTGTLAELQTEFGNTVNGYPDYFIIRNAYVKVLDDNDVDGPGLLSVEWFVENRATSNKTIRVTPETSGGETIPWLYLMYN